MNYDACGVYILASPGNGVLYVGMSVDLLGRIWTHKEKLLDGFAKRYNCTKLVYYESAPDKDAALEREKQIKKWSRFKKLRLIQSMNHEFEDLSDQLGL